MAGRAWTLAFVWRRAALGCHGDQPAVIVEPRVTGGGGCPVDEHELAVAVAQVAGMHVTVHELVTRPPGPARRIAQCREVVAKPLLAADVHPQQARRMPGYGRPRIGAAGGGIRPA